MISLGIVLSTLSEKIKTCLKSCDKRIEEGITNRKEAQKEKLRKLIDAGVTDKWHYIVDRLLEDKKVDQQEIDEYEQEFEQLDRNKDGILSHHDLEQDDENQMENGNEQQQLLDLP